MNFVPTKKTYYALWLPQNHYIIQGIPVRFVQEVSNKFGIENYDLSHGKFLFNSEKEAIAFAEIILHDYVDRSDKTTDKSWALSFDNKSAGDLFSARKELSHLLGKKELSSSFCTKHRLSDDFKIFFDPEYSGVRLVRKTEAMLYTDKPEKKYIVVDGETYGSLTNANICTNWYPYTDEQIILVITKYELMFIEDNSSEVDGSKG